ncbi:MAG: PilZ domain-containing protein [Deltaproteobacteria bacterium]|nr:PilZ domain-containing protein [Deltaproteobacteria bacterium]
MGKSPSEVRREERKPVRVFINYRTIDQFYSEIGTNLSVGGVFVKSLNPLPVGTEIKISFNIPQFGCYLESVGVVVHNGTAENPGMGIKFKSLSDRAKKLLNDVLEHELLPPPEDGGRKTDNKKSKARVTVRVETKSSEGAKKEKKTEKRQKKGKSSGSTRSPKVRKKK